MCRNLRRLVLDGTLVKWVDTVIPCVVAAASSRSLQELEFRSVTLECPEVQARVPTNTTLRRLDLIESPILEENACTRPHVGRNRCRPVHRADDAPLTWGLVPPAPSAPGAPHVGSWNLRQSTPSRDPSLPPLLMTQSCVSSRTPSVSIPPCVTWFCRPQGTKTNSIP